MNQSFNLASSPPIIPILAVKVTILIKLLFYDVVIDVLVKQFLR